MIIGVNGKIGSGKDTIGKIVQCLMNHPEITNKDLLWMINNNVVANYSKCDIKKFAGKLKQIASLLTGVPIEMFEDQEFKKTFLSREWDTIVRKPGKRQDGLFGKGELEIKQTSVRELLQKLGTEAMRDGLHTNVWVNALFADYKAIERIPEKRMSIMPNWIITDMRFPNEMEAVKERRGITIRVSRNSIYKESDTQFSKDLPHPSETALDDAEFDYEIDNNGSIEDLIEKVKEILIKEKII
jgi:hypothetical protein